MKRCPVCGSVSFDDMDVCFGCLHEFGSSVGELDEDDPFAECMDEECVADGEASSGEAQKGEAFLRAFSGGLEEGGAPKEEVIRIEIPVSALRMGFAQYVQDNGLVQREVAQARV